MVGYLLKVFINRFSRDIEFYYWKLWNYEFLKRQRDRESNFLRFKDYKGKFSYFLHTTFSILVLLSISLYFRDFNRFFFIYLFIYSFIYLFIFSFFRLLIIVVVVFFLFVERLSDYFQQQHFLNDIQFRREVYTKNSKPTLSSLSFFLV